MIDLIAALLTLAGAVFALGAGVGVVRLPDVYTRMHASTKAGTLGAGLMLAAAALVLPEGGAGLRALATFLFLLMTVSVGAHLLGRAAYRTGVPLWSGSVLDEWAEDGDGQAARPAATAEEAGGPQS